MQRYLIQESLGGNCKTSLLLCVSPAVADVSETSGTLQFGSRAMHVKQEAVINARANYEEVAEKLARELQDKEAVWQQRHAALASASKPERWGKQTFFVRHVVRFFWGGGLRPPLAYGL